MTPFINARLALLSALRGMRRAPRVHATSIIVLAACLFGAGIVRGAMRWMDSLVHGLTAQVELTLYVDETLKPEARETLLATLERQTGGAVTWVTPQEAMERLASQLGELGAVLTNLSENPLPPSVEVKLPVALQQPEKIAALATEVAKTPGVIDVDYGKAAVARVHAIARAFRWGGLLTLALAMLGTVVVVAAMLQLAIFGRKDEIEIQKLVGATPAFIQAPFLLEGALQGLLGAAIALGFLMLFGQTAWAQLTHLLGFLQTQGGVTLVTRTLVFELVLAGLLLGVVGSAMAVAGRLRT